MRLIQHIPLWNKIQLFALDEPNAAITFSSKLANQQGWTAGYTQRVIEEYRRFMLLCCISPKGASPSKAVDEAWHLHLTYTQSYWIAFCKNTLEKDIHHYPSSGGNKENHKHGNWYAETLALYEEVFGTKPPPDIWPSVVKKQYPVIPPLQWHPPMQLILLVGLLMIIPFVLCFLLYDEIVPYSVSGPEFLEFYGLLIAAGLGSFYLLRANRNNELIRLIKEYFPRDASLYQLTHLVHGRDRAVQTGVVDLNRRNLLEVKENNDIIVHNKRYEAPAIENNPLVPGFLSEADQGVVNYEMISVNWYQHDTYTHPVIEQLSALSSSQESFKRKYFVIFIVLAIGLARVAQGLFNGRPVLFLLGEMVVMAAVAFYLDHRLSGNKLIKQAGLAMLNDDRTLHQDEVVADFAAYGYGALSSIAAGLLLATVFSSYAMPPLGAKHDNSWGSSSADTGTCSGGSSCGGGGCGGCGGGGD